MRTRDIAIAALERSATQRTYVRQDVSITEQRAPTDESVKLLREMEAKAEAEVLKAVSVQSNGFECVVHMFLDHMSDKVNWRAVFKLNGKKMTATVETDPRHAVARAGEVQDFLKLRDEVAKVIAAEVLNDAFMATLRSRWSR